MKLPQKDLNYISIVQKKIINGVIEDIKIGYSTMLIVSNEGNYFNISIGNSSLISENGTELINVYDIDSKLCLGKLFKNKITSLKIDDSGNLSVSFNDDEKKIVTKSASDYEAWEINGPNQFQVVCTPGGEVAFWNEEI